MIYFFSTGKLLLNKQK